MVEFQQLGRACQSLCGFASLQMFFVPVVREGEGVRRPGSCSVWALVLGLGVVVEKCVGTVAAILRVARSRAWGNQGEGDFEWGRVFPEEMEMLCRTWSVSLGKNWRMCAQLWRCRFPGLGIEDCSRKPWEDARRTVLLAWDPLRTSRSAACPRALVFSVRFLSDEQTSAILSLEPSPWMGNGVGQTGAFPNFNHIWPAFSEPLLGYLSALSPATERNKCCLYRTYYQNLCFNRARMGSFAFLLSSHKKLPSIFFFPSLTLVTWMKCRLLNFGSCWVAEFQAVVHQCGEWLFESPELRLTLREHP